MASSAILKGATRLAEGKTKIILATPNEFEVKVVSKDDITAGDGARHDVLPGKGIAANRTTCNCFELINQLGIVPTHYLGRVSDDAFHARRVSMIPIEVVRRAVATGSYLKRNPSTQEGSPLYSTVELFYKDDERHDPLMIWQPESDSFALYKASEPVSPASFLGQLPFEEVTTFNDCPPSMLIQMMKLMVDSVFTALEKAWRDNHQTVLVDLKVEFGFDLQSGDLMLADVIDNDSWRIWPDGDKSKMLDKQVYRDLREDDPVKRQAAMDQILANFQKVAEQTAVFPL